MDDFQVKCFSVTYPIAMLPEDGMGYFSVLQRVELESRPRYDTVHGRFKHDVKIGEKDELIVNGHKIKCIQASREGPKVLPWKDPHWPSQELLCLKIIGIPPK